MKPKPLPAKRRARVRTEYSGADGWTRWVFPNMKRYLMVCCDCGLAHTLQFKAISRTPEWMDVSGRYSARVLPRLKFGVMFRARRSPRLSKKSPTPARSARRSRR